MSEETIFAAALEKANPAERAAQLEGACAGDVALRQAIAAGDNNVALMKKDADLDILRDRPDFQELLLELGRTQK
jgi:hypothetical protein